MSGPLILLPVRSEVWQHVAEQVSLRGQGDRVRSDGTIDLSDVALVSTPDADLIQLKRTIDWAPVQCWLSSISSAHINISRTADLTRFVTLRLDWVSDSDKRLFREGRIALGAKITLRIRRTDAERLGIISWRPR